MELTSTVTASGREQRVQAWLDRWLSKQPGIEKTIDPAGNVLLALKDRSRGRAPLVLEAHMDHPAFVVTEVLDPRRLRAEFRGGVGNGFFLRSKVLWHSMSDSPLAPRPGVSGTIVDFQPAPGPHSDNKVTVKLSAPADARPGDVLTWEIAPAHLVDGRLHAPAIDDLAGVAAAIVTLDILAKAPGQSRPDVRVLLTRAEEIGFVGAIAACRHHTLPSDARIVVLENSRSYAESPIGGGPIVRVGDRSCTFDPALTHQLCTVAASLATNDPAYRWQRKLMPGGTCEASAYQAMGYAASCVCLPLGNYHNMNEAARRGKGEIQAECIAISDFDMLVRLLVTAASHLDDTGALPSFRTRIEQIYAHRSGVLDER